MAKSPDHEFDGLLLEGWERCADDEKLRASSAYPHVRRLLTELTSCSYARSPDDLVRLERVVCAIRAGDYRDLSGQPEPQKQHRQFLKQQQPKRRRRRLQEPSADCALMAALAAADVCTGMSRFLNAVAAHTYDRGALLLRVTDAMLTDFRVFADTVLEARVTQIGMALEREQTAARGHYGQLTRRVWNRALLTVALVRDLMPEFDWNRYATEPGYVRLMVRPSAGCVTSAHDNDADDGARVNGLLYQLNWLRSEIDRTGAENRCLYEQHTELAAELAAVNKDIVREQAATADRVALLSRTLDELRARSAEQVCTMDRLMAAIQITKDNNKTAEAGVVDVCVRMATAAAAGDNNDADDKRPRACR